MEKEEGEDETPNDSNDHLHMGIVMRGLTLGHCTC